MSEEKSIFLSPEEISKKRERKGKTIIEHKDEEETTPSKSDSKYDDGAMKFFKRGGKVQVNFETLGRFDIPAKMYFKDYSTEHVTDLTLCNEDNLFETIIAILEETKNEDCPVSIGEALIEEFMEIMIGTKQFFSDANHEHRWLCDCQRGKEDNELQINTTIIDLNTLQYKSIEEADQILRDMSREQFISFTDEEFADYLTRKYEDEYSGNVTDYDREKEVNAIRIKEPISQNIDGHIYKFRFTRIKDLLRAKQLAEKQFSGKIKMIQNKKVHGVGMEALKEQKEKELEKIQKEKAKEVLIATRALSLISYDGRDLEKDEEKIALYRKIPRESLFEFIEFMEKLQFGIQDEREFTCPLCEKVSKRSLQRKLDPLEFIPVESAATNKSAVVKRTNIFVGI